MAYTSDTLVLNADMQPMSLLPIRTVRWQKAVEDVYNDKLIVLHEYDDWDVHSPSMTMRVPSVVMHRDYVRPRVAASWSKEHMCLRDGYTCQYCGKMFPTSQLTKDHVVPQFYGGGNGWTNLVAACHPCNNRRGHNTRIQPMRKPYKPSYYELVELRKQYPLYVPHASWADYLMWPKENLIIRH